MYAGDIVGAHTTTRAILDMQLCVCIKFPLSCTVYILLLALLGTVTKLKPIALFLNKCDVTK